MRTLFIAALVFLVLAAAFIYFIIPSRLVLSESVTIEAHQSAVFRTLTQPDMIKKWWEDPRQAGGTTGVINADGFSFQLHPGAFDIITVAARKEKAVLPDSYISIIPVEKHISRVQWKLDEAVGLHPLQRIRSYIQAKKMNSRVRSMLSHLQTFMEDAENVYGIKIENTTVSDTLLITIRKQMPALPDEKEYYILIDSLQAHIKNSAALATNYPMLHIAETDQKTYQVTAAIPVNKIIPDKGNIRLNRMIRGNILTAEVRGGLQTVMNAMQQMEHFASENGLASPAMPYQQLITNRLLEPDSLKWITRIYYPVI